MTTAIPTPEPHAWSAEALLAKAQRYAEEMHSHSRDDWQFVLWSTLMLELLARATVSRQSQALLADSRSRNNLLYSLGLPVKAAKFVPKSVAISEVFGLIGELVSDFVSDLQNFCIHHMARRNEEMHSGSTPFDVLNISNWLPIYYRSCQVLLATMGKRLDEFFVPTDAKEAELMIAAFLDRSAKAILNTVDTCKAFWEAKLEDERQKLATRSDAWATRQEGHRIKCPACSCIALVTGDPSAPPIKRIDNDEIVETQHFLPSKFECIACGLRVSGLPQLIACKLGDSFKATFKYDAAEYYIQQGMEDGYEPDFNEQ